MMWRQVLSVAAILALAGPSPAQEKVGAGVLTGEAAYGGWEQNRPGTRRLIRPQDMPLPYVSPSVGNSAGIAPRPEDMKPEAIAGFDVELFASGLDRPRVMRTAPNGDIFLADSGSGQIHVFRMNDGAPPRHRVFAEGFNRPYGIAFYPPGDNPDHVYIADEGSVSRLAYKSGDMAASAQAEILIDDLPTGGHWTRDIAFSPDGAILFVAVGSGSNAGERSMQGPAPRGFVEQNPPGATWGYETRRAAVLAFDPDGSNPRVFASGLRNCSGMAVQPANGALWCVVNERDGLGDDLPPDYATHVAENATYGWPWFYVGDNPDPRRKGERPDLAGKVTVPDVLLQPHSAPLGIAFYDGDAFPAEYRGDAFVALHGSWNRDRRTGYKVVRLLFDDDGKATGVYEDFLTGFVLDDRTVWGRPVGVAMAADGSLLVSEDAAGTIWRISASD